LSVGGKTLVKAGLRPPLRGFGLDKGFATDSVSHHAFNGRVRGAGFLGKPLLPTPDSEEAKKKWLLASFLP
jgi:hypothetical protein